MDLNLIIWNLKTYPLIIILILGVFGNGFIFYIFLRPAFRNSTITKYIHILAVTDTLLLVVGMTPNLYYAFNNQNLLDKSNSGCILHRFFMFVVGDISIWILIVITLDRLVAVVYPIKSEVWKSKKITMIVLSVVFLLCFVKNFPIIFTRGLEVNNTTNTSMCTARKKFEIYEQKVRPAISFIFYYLIPTVSITVCTVMILRKMKIVVESLKTIAVSSGNNQKHYSRSLTHMSIAINVLFFLLLTPSIFIWTILAYMQSINKVTESLLFDTTNILMFSHHALNFYLFLVTAPRFRREVLKMFGKKYSFETISKDNSNINKNKIVKETQIK